jgi:hypothetical protein
MSYIAPRDFTLDPELVQRLMKTFQGDLELDWMTSIKERIAARPSQPKRGLTLDDINQGGYSPDELPEIVRRNFSMARARSGPTPRPRSSRKASHDAGPRRATSRGRRSTRPATTRTRPEPSASSARASSPSDSSAPIFPPSGSSS